MACEHFPHDLHPIGPKAIINKCTDCKEKADLVCVTCNKGFCGSCSATHNHFVFANQLGYHCTKCAKEFPLSLHQKYSTSLPPFIPRNIKGFGLYMKAKHPKKIVVMAGAGMSTSAGIPDFRTPGTGLYDNLEKYDLPYPTAVFDIDYFEENPQPFYTLAKELMPGIGKYFPTPTHHFVGFLNNLKVLSMLFTQNIDGLETVANIPDDKTVFAHGHYNTGHCLKCKKLVQKDEFIDDVMLGKVSKCKCGGVIKPDIVFFGENLPKRFFDSFKYVKDCDLLICIGTSLVVEPFASLAEMPELGTPRVLINMEDVGDFNYKDDLKLLGKCDDIIFDIVNEIGQKDAFQKYLDAFEFKK
ncbi:NAD-dependent deacetylase sirtuin-2, putative [Entamoeba invadens IP1]|uniref:NAD-dependent deacetylase sirtuin-2, putative n=1 Tax=Entamoeba invadens IP1 TaxID=370355 RepID=A0A0A1UGH7_ENTIV|nr:NAD-dependent deacetylase sirtuin-2, putative [Entamoeba invadens IP1]ELP92667.1 NAD-dependent deacetylase sirtuin-2, putative [Entamoeba invadens IP1]|eukprot:XP_004259438.1 NAD-dependent deacetylase sirtuin-2, putative [Entamoeba invadens IP1]